jgi:L-alanine-DL-glutamate epimerase-like enolase superfamily enzyme
MKIKDIKLHVMRVIVPGGTMSADLGSFGGDTELGFLRLITNEGIEGNCFVGTFNHSGQPLFEHIIASIKPEIIGRDASEHEWLWNRLGRLIFRRHVTMASWAAVDIALWDIMGKEAGMPVYRMLGQQRDKIPAYVSSSYHPTTEEYVEEALYFKGQGLQAYKYHPGGAPVERVKEIARKVRQAVGPEMKLMVDCSLAYTYHDALEMGPTLDEMNFHWFEDPFRYLDMDALVELARRTRTPLAVSDHPDFTFFEIVPFIQRGAARIIRGDARKVGITGLKKAATLCEGFGLNYEIHQGGNSLINAANLNVELSIANCEFFEMLLPQEANQFGVLNDISVDDKGYVHAPSKPGLGYEVDWDLVNRMTLKVL